MDMQSTPSTRITGWMVLRPLLGLLLAVGGILLCVVAITWVTGPLVDGPHEWLGHTIVGSACLGTLVCGYVGIQCKVRFAVSLRDWLIQFFL